MSDTNNHSFDWGSFLLGIFFVFAALMSFQDPAGNLLAIVIVFAIFAIVKGVFDIIVKSRARELVGRQSIIPIITGVFDILIGIYFLFNLDIGISVLPYVFAIWFIFDSVLGLFLSNFARVAGEGYYWFSIIVCVLGIILGILLLFHPVSSALTLSFLVGIYFMMYGIYHIVYAFK